VNDPNTAVRVIEEQGFVLRELAQIPAGPYGRYDESGRARVWVSAQSFGDRVTLATEQIVLYGSGDPAVVRALVRLASILESLQLNDPDRVDVDSFVARVWTVAVPQGLEVG